MCADKTGGENARTSETGRELNSIMPYLLDITNDNIKKYIEICDRHRPRKTGFVSYSCLLCSSDCMTEVQKHLEIRQHVDAVAALCFHCSAILVSDRKVGFGPHLESEEHKCVVTFQKGKNVDITFGKEQFEAVETELKKLSAPAAASQPKPVEARVEQTMEEEFQNLNIGELVPPNQGKKPRPQGDRIITFQLKGKFPNFLSLYEELRKHGKISFLARHTNGFEACVTFEPLFGPLYLGIDVETKKLYKAPKIIEDIEKDPSWEHWSNRYITPECRKVFCYKRIWENHMENVLSTSEKRFALFNTLQDSMRKSLRNLLSGKYSDVTVSFYGPCLTGLMTEDDFVYIYLGLENREMTNVTKLFKTSKGDFKLMSESPLVLSFNDIFQCAVTNYQGLFESSLAIRTLSMLSEEARWLILTVKQWWRLNDPHPSSSALTTEDGLLEWMVLFFLMSDKMRAVPCVDFLISIGADEEDLLEGQVTPFSTDVQTIGMYFEEDSASSNTKKPNSLNLVSFFLFYLNLNLHNTVLCPLNGVDYQRHVFLENVPPDQRAALEGDAFIMPHPFDPLINIFGGLSKKDYFFFRNRVESTIEFMIS